MCVCVCGGLVKMPQNFSVILTFHFFFALVYFLFLKLDYFTEFEEVGSDNFCFIFLLLFLCFFVEQEVEAAYDNILLTLLPYCYSF